MFGGSNISQIIWMCRDHTLRISALVAIDEDRYREKGVQSHPSKMKERVLYPWQDLPNMSFQQGFQNHRDYHINWLPTAKQPPNPKHGQTQVTKGSKGDTCMAIEVTWMVFWLVSNIFRVHPYLGIIFILSNIVRRGWYHQLVFL